MKTFEVVIRRVTYELVKVDVMTSGNPETDREEVVKQILIDKANVLFKGNDHVELLAVKERVF